MRLTFTLFDPAALIGGPTVTRSFDHTGGTIGRAESNDWVLADPRQHLSEQHCRVEYRDDGYALVDTSATGVYVNESNQALGFGNAARLQPGDRLALGDYLLSVALDDGAMPTPEPAAAAAGAAEPAPPIFPAPPPEPIIPGLAAPPPTDAEVPPVAAPLEAAPPVPEAPARPPNGEATDILALDRREARASRRHGGRTKDSPPRDEARPNECLGALLVGAGIAPTELPRDQTVELMGRAGAMLREAVSGLHDVVRVRAGLRRGETLDGPRLGMRDDNPVIGTPAAEDAVATLLGLTGPLRQPPEKSIRDVTADIAAHARAGRTAIAHQRRTRIALGALACVLILGAGAAYYALAQSNARIAAIASTPPPAVDVPVTAPSPPPAPIAPPAAPAPPPPALDRSALRGALTELFRSYDCAHLGAEIADDGTVMLSGFVSRGDALTRLHREVSGLPHVTRVDNRATVEPWPFCEIERLLATQTAGGRGAPQIAISHADGVYREGEVLIVTATAHAAADSYLTVDFFDTDGKVVHMLPTSQHPDNRLSPNQRVALGTTPDKAGRNERVYVIAPPFGTGRVVALSSARPLFTELRPEQEDAGTYLAALASVLVRDPAGTGSAARITSNQQTITLVAR